MEKVLREHFAAVRQERGLTQTRVATRGGVKQSTISKIEIEPDYEPSVASFLKAIHGLGLTASAFFAQIEALPQHAPISDNAPPRPEDPDEGLPAFYSEERIAQNVLRLLAKIAREGVEEGEEERPANHRLSANPRALAADRRQDHRARRRRDVPPKTKKRPRKPPKE